LCNYIPAFAVIWLIDVSLAIQEVAIQHSLRYVF